jgi:hypothetical protein
MSSDPIRRRYERVVEVPFAGIPTATAAEHTMGSAIDSYSTQRLPDDVLDLALRAGLRIEVHGIYPDHVAAVLPTARLLHPGHLFGVEKVFNVVRPQLFCAPADPRRRDWRLGDADRLVLAVPPGRDYLMHNASLVRHYLRVRGYNEHLLRRVVRYPDAESSIAEWTGLAEFVRPGDRILMGYVRELVPHLITGGGSILEKRGNRFYGIARIESGAGRSVCALGVRFSFWGCISARLTAACAHLGAEEVVYVGKLGTLTDPRDVYHRLYAPSSYLDHGHSPRLLDRDIAPRNGLLDRYPGLDTGRHMSVATVLEEDLAQRAVADTYRVRSIDNEIAQMATAISTAGSADRPAFSALHFATDYLRRPDEPVEPTGYNLTSHRRAGALFLKQRALGRIGALLRHYYACGPIGTATPAALSIAPNLMG